MNSTQAPFTKEQPLKAEQKRKIWEIIYENMQPGDRHPSEVIADAPYNGDEEKYLREMAHWHKVAL